MITYGGYPLLLEDERGALSQFLEDYLPLEDVRQFGWIPSTMLLQMTSQAHGGLPLPNYSTPLRPKINTLYHPTGASRWAFGFFLADEDTKNSLTGLSSPQQNLVLSEDGKNLLTFEMFMLPPRPISAKDASGTGVWLIPLVDRRYYWQFVNSGPIAASYGSWTSLYSSVSGALNITLTVDTIPSAYLTPSPTLAARQYDNAAVLLDAIAASVGQRIVWDCPTGEDIPNPASWRAQNFGSGYALSRLGLNEVAKTLGSYTFSNTQISGDKYSTDYPNAAVPGNVQVLFQKGIQSHILAQPASYVKQLVSTNLGFQTQYQSATTFKVIRSSAVATYNALSDPTPSNQSTIDALATQIATDYYNSLSDRYDRTYASLKVWQPCAYDDWIEWSFGLRRKGERASGHQYAAQTRVQSLPINYGVDEQFQDVSGAVWLPDVIEGILYGDLALPGTVSTAQLNVYGTNGTYGDTGLKVTITNRDATFEAPAGTYLMCRWMNALAEWRPIPTISPADMYVVGTLASTLASGGNATLNVQKWNGSAWVSSGSSVTVYEFFGISSTLAIGTKIGAMWHEQAARYIAITKPGC